MEAVKCPIGMMWYILCMPVFRRTSDETIAVEDYPKGQSSLPNLDIFPLHIRPPPALAGSPKSFDFA